MKRSTLQQILVFVALVCSGVALRLTFRHLPNFAPVAALSLFAGFYFRSGLLALAVPLLVMGISDQFMGGYHWFMMLTVYGMLAAPVAMRWFLKANLDLGSRNVGRVVRNAIGLLACSLGASVAFFLMTNLATWAVSGLYATTWSGLMQCYVQAIPFFRYTLSGDLAFGFVLFAGYAMCLQLAQARLRTSPAAI